MNQQPSSTTAPTQSHAARFLQTISGWEQNVAKLGKVSRAHLEEFYDGLYELGQRAWEALNTPYALCAGVSREDVIAEMAAEAKRSPQSIEDCMKVTATLSPQEYQALYSRSDINWVHIVYLSGVPDRQERDELVARCCSEKWTPPQLLRAILKQNPTEKRKRVPQPPTNARVALERLNKHSTNYLTTVDRMCVEYDLPNWIKQMPADKITETHRGHVAQAIELLRAVAKDATIHTSSLQDTLSQVDRILAARAAKQAQLPEQVDDLNGGRRSYSR